MEKSCRTCKEVKALDDYYRSKSAKDGRRSECKTCSRGAARRWNLENKDRVKETNKRHRETEKYKETRKAYREGPARERILEQKRESWARHRESNVAKLRNRWAENADVYNARRRSRYMEDPEYRALVKEQQRVWREANRDHLRNKALQWGFGITSDDFDAMLATQNGCCAICSADITGVEEVNGLKGRVKAHVDHCHDSGKIRGLLCTNCNKALGLLRDDPERIRAAAAYVEFHAVNQ